ncbi:MAG: phosphoribosyl-AMP cyclohydrolase [Candidatus Altiarchaeota archaeon]|nr:phosphoribosyl-AMP cyclohydrolase [Candidatus Altiarchaeota archaeon]
MESINADAEFLSKSLKFREVDGNPDLVLAIAQDHKTDEVLMVAYANMDAIKKTLETGKMHYYSTSRKTLWMKGESSGHVQEVKELYVDCDGDALLFKVEQKGGACHTGYRSCFYRKIKGRRFEVTGKKVFEPEDVY